MLKAKTASVVTFPRSNLCLAGLLWQDWFLCGDDRLTWNPVRNCRRHSESVQNGRSSCYTGVPEEVPTPDLRVNKDTTTGRGARIRHAVDVGRSALWF